MSQCASGLFKSHSTSHALENSGTRGFVPWRHIASGNLTEKLSICLKINPQSVILSFLSIFPSGRCPRVRPRLLDRRRRSFPAVFPHTIGRFVPPSPRFSLLPISFFFHFFVFSFHLSPDLGTWEATCVQPTSSSTVAAWGEDKPSMHPCRIAWRCHLLTRISTPTRSG